MGTFLGRFWPLAREQEHERGAHAWLAPGFYGAPVGLGDLAGDGESEAYSLLGPRTVRPVEALEDEGQLVLGDPNPRIRDRQRHAVVFLLHPYRDAPAVRRVLDRVVQENGNHLHYPLSIEGGRSEERRVGKECRSRWSPY